MNRDDIIKLAREQGLPETETEGVFRVNTDDLGRMLAAEREKVAQWMMAQGYSTGHGDSIEDLLTELEWQIRESEREACAKVCEEITNELSNWPAAYDGVTAETKFIRGIGEMLGEPFVEAIRARSKQ